MPIYEYHCDACDTTFEDWARHIDDNTEKPCPKCGAPAERIMSHTSFVLKGGGWYVTDYGYRKGKAEENKPATSASNTPTSGSGDGSSAPSASAPAPASTTAAPSSTPAASSGSSGSASS